MGNYFADLVSAGATLAIENVPIRDLEELERMPNSTRKQKSMKNISYGMTILEIDQIMAITRKNIELRTGDIQLAHNKVRVTYDTGHSLRGIGDEQLRKSEVEKWIQYFKNDINIFHITPDIEKDSDGNYYVEEQKSKKIIKWVYELIKKYNIDALTFLEAHASLEVMSKLYDISCNSLANILPMNDKLNDSLLER